MRIFLQFWLVLKDIFYNLYKQLIIDLILDN